jgi:hypothetical protein
MSEERHNYGESGCLCIISKIASLKRVVAAEGQNLHTQNQLIVSIFRIARLSS